MRQGGYRPIRGSGELAALPDPALQVSNRECLIYDAQGPLEGHFATHYQRIRTHKR
jgi:hypothetical protein